MMWNLDMLKAMGFNKKIRLAALGVLLLSAVTTLVVVFVLVDNEGAGNDGSRPRTSLEVAIMDLEFQVEFEFWDDCLNYWDDGLVLCHGGGDAVQPYNGRMAEENGTWYFVDKVVLRSVKSVDGWLVSIGVEFGHDVFMDRQVVFQARYEVDGQTFIDGKRFDVNVSTGEIFFCNEDLNNTWYVKVMQNTSEYRLTTLEKMIMENPMLFFQLIQDDEEENVSGRRQLAEEKSDGPDFTFPLAASERNGSATLNVDWNSTGLNKTDFNLTDDDEDGTFVGMVDDITVAAFLIKNEVNETNRSITIVGQTCPPFQNATENTDLAEVADFAENVSMSELVALTENTTVPVSPRVVIPRYMVSVNADGFPNGTDVDDEFTEFLFGLNETDSGNRRQLKWVIDPKTPEIFVQPTWEWKSLTKEELIASEYPNWNPDVGLDSFSFSEKADRAEWDTFKHMKYSSKFAKEHTKKLLDATNQTRALLEKFAHYGLLADKFLSRARALGITAMDVVDNLNDLAFLFLLTERLLQVLSAIPVIGTVFKAMEKILVTIHRAVSVKLQIATSKLEKIYDEVSSALDSLLTLNEANTKFLLATDLAFERAIIWPIETTKNCESMNNVSKTVVSSIEPLISVIQNTTTALDTFERFSEELLESAEKTLQNLKTRFSGLFQFMQTIEEKLLPVTAALTKPLKLTLPWLCTKPVEIAIWYPSGVKWCSFRIFRRRVWFPCGFHWSRAIKWIHLPYPCLHEFSFSIMQLLDATFGFLGRLFDAIADKLRLNKLLDSIHIPGLDIQLNLDLEGIHGNLTALVGGVEHNLDSARYISDLLKPKSCGSTLEHNLINKSPGPITFSDYDELTKSCLSRFGDWKLPQCKTTSELLCGKQNESCAGYHQVTYVLDESYDPSIHYLNSSFALDLKAKLMNSMQPLEVNVTITDIQSGSVRVECDISNTATQQNLEESAVTLIHQHAYRVKSIITPFSSKSFDLPPTESPTATPSQSPEENIWPTFLPTSSPTWPTPIPSLSPTDWSLG